MFLSQVSVADIVLGTKADACNAAAVDSFLAWAAQLQPPKRVLTVRNSVATLEELGMVGWGEHQGAAGVSASASASAQAAAAAALEAVASPRPRGETWLTSTAPRPRQPRRVEGASAVERASGAVTCGWVFHGEDEFDREGLLRFATAAAPQALRLKGVCRVGADEWVLVSTGGGQAAPGLASAQVSVTGMSRQEESRVEVIVSARAAPAGAVGGAGLSEPARALALKDWDLVERELIALLIT